MIASSLIADGLIAGFDTSSGGRLVAADYFDNLEGTSVFKPAVGMALKDNVIASEILAANFKIHTLFADQASAKALLNYAATALISEGVSVSDGFSAGFSLLAEFSSLISAVTNFSSNSAIAAELMDLIAARELFNFVESGDLQDNAEVIEQLQTAIKLLTDSSDFAEVFDSLTFSVFAFFSDSAALDEAFDSGLSLSAAFSDAALCFSHFEIDGIAYTAYVMNTETTAVSTYSNYLFNSIVCHKGKTYGVSDSGIYLLDGETDDGEEILVRLKTGDINFGTDRFKSCPVGWLYALEPEKLLLKITHSNHGRRVEQQYIIYSKGWDGPDDEAGRRVPLEKTFRALYWQYEIQNVTGQKFDLAGLKVKPVFLSRKG